MEMNIEDLIGQRISSDILEQLKVEGRVKFDIKPTAAPDVKSTGESDYSNPDIDEEKRDIPELINHIKDMESLVEDLENLSNNLLKDMNIAPANPTVAKAAKRLGSPDGNITKDILDTALAIMDYLPIMTMGQDPILGALTGDGRTDGEWADCSEITKGFADKLKATIRSRVEEQKLNIPMETKESWMKQQTNMMWYILKMLFWNMIWVKFIVDMCVVNPIKVMIARPFDGIVCFFRRFDKEEKLGSKTIATKRRFKAASYDQLEFYGKVHNILRNIRIKLLCVPYKIWKDYDPPEDPVTGEKFSCTEANQPCIKGKQVSASKFDTTGSGKVTNDALGSMVDDANSSANDCVDIEDIIGSFQDQITKGVGMSPECAAAAQLILDAVVADAVVPNTPLTEGSSSGSFAGGPIAL